MRMRPLAVVVLLTLLTACGGPRVVNDEWSPGVPKRQGQTQSGKQQGMWSYFYSNGARQAAGAWDGDFQTGVWRWWYANGQLQQEGSYRAREADGRLLDGRQHSAGIREGHWRFWNDDGTLASEGGYVNDRQEGAWVYYGKEAKGEGAAAKRFGDVSEAPSPMPTGTRFARGVFTAGVKDQYWTWWHPNGAQRQVGTFRLGLKTGLWTTWDPDGSIRLREEFTQSGQLAVTKAEPPPPPAPKPEPAAPVVVNEPVAPPPVAKPVEVTPAPPVVVKAAEPELTIPPADEPALSPSPVQPAVWTSGQEGNAAALVRLYATGETALMVGYDDGSFGGSASTADRQKRDLLGKPLSATRFLAADGKVIDLKERSGKRPAVLVFLRGFSGQVCLYCAAQTSALANAMPQFTNKGVDVFLVYPGPVDAVPAFIQAVKSLRKDPPPMPVLLDVSLLAVRALGIEDNLSKPTSLIIDAAGQVRWAYVGKTIADRPAVTDLLREAAKYVK